jgi:Uma2 family endonuclease
VQEWLENGVTEVWVVYPMSREVIVYRNDAATRVFAATDTIESAVLPGFSAPVASLFPSDLPLPAPLS